MRCDIIIIIIVSVLIVRRACKSVDIVRVCTYSVRTALHSPGYIQTFDDGVSRRCRGIVKTNVPGEKIDQPEYTYTAPKSIILTRICLEKKKKGLARNSRVAGVVASHCLFCHHHWIAYDHRHPIIVSCCASLLNTESGMPGQESFFFPH